MCTCGTRAHTHTHTETETLAKRDRGTNKKAEESCFSSPHTLRDKNEKDRYRHGGGTALTPTSDFKKKAIISLVYLCCTPVRVLAVLLAVGPTARLNHFVWRGLAHSSVRARSHFRRWNPLCGTMSFLLKNDGRVRQMVLRNYSVINLNKKHVKQWQRTCLFVYRKTLVLVFQRIPKKRNKVYCYRRNNFLKSVALFSKEPSNPQSRQKNIRFPFIKTFQRWSCTQRGKHNTNENAASGFILWQTSIWRKSQIANKMSTFCSGQKRKSCFLVWFLRLWHTFENLMESLK